MQLTYDDITVLCEQYAVVHNGLIEANRLRDGLSELDRAVLESYIVRQFSLWRLSNEALVAKYLEEKQA